MKVYIATDHAGFELKAPIISLLESLGHTVEDVGAFELKPDDDYPDIIARAARGVMHDREARAVVLGASGQGEAIVANRFPGVRAVVYYGSTGVSQVDAEGETHDMLDSTREHNDANVLSLGARFLSEDQALSAVERWVSIPFSGEARHMRRIRKIDEQTA